MIPLAFLGGLDIGAQGLPADRPRHQHRRPLADRRAGVRLGAGRDRRLRDRARAGCPCPLAGPRAPTSSSQIKYLLLPALVLVGVLFGYVSRMVRAGTIEALDADYTRTAYLKGLGLRTVLFKHVLRNALAAHDRRRRDADRLPARRARDRRARVQLSRAGPGDRQPRGAQGLLGRAGGGHGDRRDLPHGDGARRHRLLAAEPAHPLRRAPNERCRIATPSPVAIPMAAPARSSRRETLTRLLRTPTFLIAAFVIAFWTFCAIFGYRIAPHDPTFQTERHPAQPESAVPVRHRLSSAATCSRA